MRDTIKYNLMYKNAFDESHYYKKYKNYYINQVCFYKPFYWLAMNLHTGTYIWSKMQSRKVDVHLRITNIIHVLFVNVWVLVDTRGKSGFCSYLLTTFYKHNHVIIYLFLYSNFNNDQVFHLWLFVLHIPIYIICIWSTNNHKWSKMQYRKVGVILVMHLS